MRNFMLTLVVSGILIGCGGSNQDLERWVQEALARPPNPIEPIPPIVQPESFTYEAGLLRDPFMRPQQRSVVDAGSGSGPRPDADRRREYLENFPLDALEMVGTIETPDVHFGLISDVEETIHRVREGNYIGQNHGRILRITPVAVEVMELVPDGTDGWMEREARIALREDQRG